MPADVLSRLLPMRSRFSLNVLSHVFLQAKLQRKAHDVQKVSKRIQEKRLRKVGYDEILRGLSRWIARLRPRDCSKTVWNDYADRNSYSDVSRAHKASFVANFVSRTNPALLFDIGCNSGDYSALALRNGARFVVGLESDIGALEQAFRRACAENLEFLPLYIDVANPSPDQGWLQRERAGLASRARGDAVLALAVVHHMVIGRNLPIRDVVNWIMDVAMRGVIEFVPKSDPMVRDLLALREQAFADYNESRLETLINARGRVVRKRSCPNQGESCMNTRPSRSRRALRAALASTGVVTTLLFFVPVTIYSGNQPEFSAALFEILLTLMPLAAFAVLAAALIAAVIGDRGASVLTSALAFLAVLMYAQGNFLVWDYGSFDGRTIDWGKYLVEGLLDGLVWAVVLCAAILAHEKLLPLALKAVSVVLLIQIVAVAVHSVSTGDLRWSASRIESFASARQAISEFSSDMNVLHIVLDGLQTDIFMHLVESDPDVADALEGFTVFRNNLGVYPYTQATIPALASGKVFLNEQPFPAFLDDAMAGKTIFSAASDAGWEVDVAAQVALADVYGKAPTKNTYGIPRDSHASRRDFVIADSARLVDLSLFRVFAAFRQSASAQRRALACSGDGRVRRLPANAVFRGPRISRRSDARVSCESGYSGLQNVSLDAESSAYCWKRELRSTMALGIRQEKTLRSRHGVGWRQFSRCCRRSRRKAYMTIR